MREINNNSNNLNFSGIQKFDPQKESQPQPAEPSAEQEPQKELQDLSQMPSAITGRSLVFTGNSIDKDLQFLMKNPEFCEKANSFFDIAEKQFGYEEASKLMDGFVNEFKKQP